MSRRTRHIVYVFLALLDVALIVVSYLLSARIYMGSLATLAGLNQLRMPLWSSAGMTALIVYAAIVVSIYAISRMYGCVYNGQIRQMAKRVFMTNTVCIVIFAAILYLFHLDDVSRMTMFLFYVTSTLFVMFKQWVTIQVFYRLRRGKRALRNVVVVGCGNLAQFYANTIGTDPTRQEHVIGYVVPSGPHASEEEIAGECPLLRERLGGIGMLDAIMAKTNARELVIALETNEYDDIQKAFAVADKHGTRLTLVPFYTKLMPRQPEIDPVNDVKLVNMRSIPLDNPFAAAYKRTTDVAVSLVVIALTWWLMLIAAIGVKASSPGPVFFTQTRIGKNNKPFTMLKFRSMRLNDESATAWSTDVDPRRTKFGAFIRKYSIDELPQFFNVLSGKMSIVGPRPEIRHYVDEFRESVPRYMLRHQVRPGITGWAQINGFRGDTPMVGRAEHDLWYIDNWSPWLDVKIFFRTLFGGFVNKEKLA